MPAFLVLSHVGPGCPLPGAEFRVHIYRFLNETTDCDWAAATSQNVGIARMPPRHAPVCRPRKTCPFRIAGSDHGLQIRYRNRA